MSNKRSKYRIIKEGGPLYKVQIRDRWLFWKWNYCWNSFQRNGWISKELKDHEICSIRIEPWTRFYDEAEKYIELHRKWIEQGGKKKKVIAEYE